MVEAAGGVVWRRADGKDGKDGKDGEIEALLVHRPRYDDWSLPKGKLDPGETHEAAALREVEEETGLRCRLGPELSSASYRDGADRPKVVRYWAMTVLGGEFEPNSEVDKVRWLRLGKAAQRLTYAHDVVVLKSFTQMSLDRKV